MKQIFVITVLLLTASSVMSADDSLALSRERQLQIVQDYMIATGQISEFERQQLYSDDEGNALPIKCGTAAVLDFQLNRDKIDPSILKSLGTAVAARPDGLPFTYVSPTGHFLLHYAKTGAKACYQPTVDSDADGVPNFVESIAIIADSVYTNIITVMNYPLPPSDSLDAGYNGGGDAKHDIYLDALGQNFYGLTWADSIRIDGALGRKASSFLVLDNDYQQIAGYENRPLDAVRVTVAHEYFHAVQFGIDIFETESNGPNDTRQYWMEMSAVWMEEHLYDGINDYYGYLPTFFKNPTLSLQQFAGPYDLHPYASVVFPLFLSEEFNDDIIRKIWIKCGEGTGPNFLYACQSVTDSLLGVPDTGQTWQVVFANFATWNYFTGSRSVWAPTGIGYSERENYPEIPADSILRLTSYPFLMTPDSMLRLPEHNGTIYFEFDSTRAIDYVADSLLTFYMGLDWRDFRRRWALSVMYRFANNTDSFANDVGWIRQDTNQSVVLAIPDPRLYKNVVFAVSPASPDIGFYSYNSHVRYDVALFTSEKLDSSLFGPPNPAEVNLTAQLFYPFPNPAVVSELPDGEINFRLRVPTNDIAHYVFTRPLLHLDIYSVAGEYIDEAESAVDIPVSEENRQFVFNIPWKVGNSAGKEIASGAYIAIVRLYSSSDKKQLLVEKTTKVAIIR